MKERKIILSLVPLVFFIASCGGKKQESEVQNTEPVESMIPDPVDPKENKGIGPIAVVELDAEIDEEMASNGKAVFDEKCVACHHVDKRVVGPSPRGVLDRRSPEWVMNMILNPEEMVSKDPIAKALLEEYNGSPMANQNLSEEEARSVLEYFRTLN